MHFGAIRKGPRNHIGDVGGISVGNAEDIAARTGVTVVLPDARAVAACDVRGGGPGTRETDALDPVCLVDEVEDPADVGAKAAATIHKAFVGQQSAVLLLSQRMVPIKTFGK